MSVRRFCAAFLSICFALTLCTCSVGAGDISTDDELIVYSAEAERMYAKIDEVALAKAAVNQYRSKYNISSEDPVVDPVLAELIHEVDRINFELLEMGAIAEPMVDAALLSLEDASSDLVGYFQALYGDYYDIYGIPQQVNASYGTYYTYDIVIQDKYNGSILSTHIRQGDSDGFDVLAYSSPIYEIIRDELLEATMFKVAGYLSGIIPGVGVMLAGSQAVKDIIDFASQGDVDEAYTMSGNSRSYRIFCDSVPSVHFVYVRENENEAWSHTYTYNTVAIEENHEWYFVVSQNGQPLTFNDEETITDILRPNDYSYRLTRAVSAFRNNRELDRNVVNEYTVSADGADNVRIDAFTLDITCPITTDDISRYAAQ